MSSDPAVKICLSVRELRAFCSKDSGSEVGPNLGFPTWSKSTWDIGPFGGN